MLRNKRVLQRRNNKIIKVIGISLFTLVFLFAGIAGFVFLQNKDKPLFVSPLSRTFPLNANADTEKQVDVLKKKLTEKQIVFTSVTVDKGNYTIKLKDDQTVILTNEKDLDSQISSLQYIMSHLTMEGKPFSRLDLRFEKPIIVFK